MSSNLYDENFAEILDNNFTKIFDNASYLDVEDFAEILDLVDIQETTTIPICFPESWNITTEISIVDIDTIVILIIGMH